MKRNLIQAVCFTIIFLTLFLVFNSMFKERSNEGALQLERFYREEPNTMDMVCLGTSHIYMGINPAVLWDNYGIAACNLSAGHQPAWSTYYYAKEMLKYQKPKVVVLDTYTATLLNRKDVLYEDGQHVKYPRIVQSTIGLKPSKNKLEAIQVNAPIELRADLAFGLPLYHTRYEELTIDNLQSMDPENLNHSMNFMAQWDTQVFEQGVTKTNEGTATLHAKGVEYFYKTVELLKENDIQVLLINTPQVLTENSIKEQNSVQKIAAELGVELLDFNDKYEEIGWDFSKDMWDKNHAAVPGSTKLTSCLGEILREDYNVPDRRGGEKYASWELCSAEWQQHVRNHDLQNTETIGDFLELADDPNYFVAMYMNAVEAPDRLEVKTDAHMLLNDFGVDSGLAHIVQYDFMAAVDGGEKIYEIYGDEAVAKKFDTGGKEIRVSIGGNTGKTSCIMVGNERADNGKPGMNIVVYDKLLGIVVDGVSCDVFQTDELVR